MTGGSIVGIRELTELGKRGVVETGTVGRGHIRHRKG